MEQKEGNRRKGEKKRVQLTKRVGGVVGVLTIGPEAASSVV